MKWKISDLQVEVENLLGSAGLPPELYIIRSADDYVAVMFDKKEAVDYFRVDFESSNLGKDCIYEYKKVGKKHAAYIYSW